jgi:hypothetical protein
MVVMSCYGEAYQSSTISLILIIIYNKKGMRMNEKKHIILTNMNTDLWKKFKGVCYTNGKSMNHVVSQLIEQYISNQA